MHSANSTGTYYLLESFAYILHHTVKVRNRLYFISNIFLNFLIHDRIHSVLFFQSHNLRAISCVMEPSLQPIRKT